MHLKKVWTSCHSLLPTIKVVKTTKISKEKSSQTYGASLLHLRSKLFFNVSFVVLKRVIKKISISLQKNFLFKGERLTSNLNLLKQF